VQSWDGAPAGVICSLRFSGGVARTAESPHLAPDDEPGAWWWTHLALGDVRSLTLLRAVPDLPRQALELFTGLETRVQITGAGGWVSGVLPDMERDLSGHAQGPGRLVFAFDGGRLITGRLHPLLVVDDLRRRAELGAALAAPPAAIIAYVDLYVDRLEAELEEFDLQLAAIEDYVLTEPQTPRDTGLAGVRRRVARGRRELQGLRTALARAYAGRQGRRVESLHEALADLIAAIDDVDRDAGVLQDRGRLLHEEIDTLINAATNRSMRALTIVSTLLIPPTLISGAFGMNVPGIPFEHSTNGFAVATAICALCVGVAFLVLRRLGM
jgi:zinc transporter